jgi:hypothetical protein
MRKTLRQALRAVLSGDVGAFRLAPGLVAGEGVGGLACGEALAVELRFVEAFDWKLEFAGEGGEGWWVAGLGFEVVPEAGEGCFRADGEEVGGRWASRSLDAWVARTGSDFGHGVRRDFENHD